MRHNSQREEDMTIAQMITKGMAEIEVPPKEEQWHRFIKQYGPTTAKRTPSSFLKIAIGRYWFWFWVGSM